MRQFGGGGKLYIEGGGKNRKNPFILSSLAQKTREKPQNGGFFFLSVFLTRLEKI